jgi:aminoglycoside 3-N-acetyltransferase
MLDIPENEHIMIHVKLSNIFELPKIHDYDKYVNLILENIRNLKPKSIVVPTFTYSYTKSGSFSLKRSNSEVGRFSEEIRKKSAPSLRTLDPVFSVIDVDNFGFVTNNWSKEAFGQESIWKKWDDLNGVILNINLQKIVSTQFHFIEKYCNVPYRFDKNFNGTVSKNDNISHSLSYKYYVRSLKLKSDFNRDKILADMIKSDIVTESIWNCTNVRWFRARDLRNLIQSKIALDPLYLINK